MGTLLTSGVLISVKTHYRADLSDIPGQSYFFNYMIEIVNQNNYEVQLMTREWYIFDSLSQARYVSGEGVVGEQPVLKPGEQYLYTSGCEIHSDIGMMKGFYTFRNLKNGDLFQVFVPTFLLEYDGKLN